MRFPERGIAVLRIAVGLWFVKSILTKLGFVLLGGVVPFPAASPRWVATMPKLIAKYAEGNPIDWYREFLFGTVIPQKQLFANLTAYGETAVGIGLTLGVFTVVAALVGLVLVVTYGMATFHMSPSQQGFHLLLATCMLVFIAVRAGRRWGIDAWLHQRHPRAFITRLPLG
jgi:thiosulfate dehydrogenase (quinone) large subunit